ncbi:hypothetical protein JTE90_020574 [Oedothorax gibbosus]|uniref:Uncharacterized protein n=1 Tax=Oedothorax gibbosus TaxID=931172 RepID=A0AAV6VWY0_9ARAC|nr:hypothetical protein JTE90_020574 [Oedothorax gibbosus]
MQQISSDLPFFANMIKKNLQRVGNCLTSLQLATSPNKCFDVHVLQERAAITQNILFNDLKLSSSQNSYDMVLVIE